MKKCDKHHGEIQYDEIIYTDCPMCKMHDYDEIVEDNTDTGNHNDALKTAVDDAYDEMDRAIKCIEEAQSKLESV